MATTYTLTTAPTTVSANGMTGGALIRAVGGTVYAGDDPGTGPTDGMPVYAGETCTWDPGRPLYLTGASGASAVVDYNSGSSVFPAAGVASQLISQNLPDLIAQRIAINGSPPIDIPQAVAIFSSESSFPPGPVTLASNLFGPLQVYDVTRFQSLRFNIGSQYSGTAPAADFHAFTFKFYDYTSANGGLWFSTGETTITGHSLTSIMGSIPTNGSYVQITASRLIGSTAVTYYGTVFGSVRAIPKPSWEVKNDAWQKTTEAAATMSAYGLDYIKIAFTGSGSVGYYPSFNSGSGLLSWTTDLAAASNSAGVTVQLDTINIPGTSHVGYIVSDTYNKDAALTSHNRPFVVGGMQSLLYVSNSNTVAANLYISLSFTS